MWEEIIRSIPAYLLSSLKFILGPSVGFGSGLHPLTTILVTIAGMMTSVVIFTYFGEWMRVQVLNRFFKRSEKSQARRERSDTRWKKFGLFGIAFFTPVFLTPIGGTILAVSFGSPKAKILLYMLISATVWSVIFTVAIYAFGHQSLPAFVKW